MITVFIHTFARLGLLAMSVAVGVLLFDYCARRSGWYERSHSWWWGDSYCRQVDCMICFDRVADCEGCGGSALVDDMTVQRWWNSSHDYDDVYFCPKCVAEAERDYPYSRDDADNY